MAASTYFQESRHRSATSRVMIESRQEYLSKAVDGADISGGSSSNQALGTGFRHQSQSRQSYQFFKNWVYVAVNSLAKKLASQPLCVGEITDASPNPARSLPPQTKSAVATFLKNSAEAETLEIIESHPALDVFANPNPVQGKFEFFYSSVVNLQITGEAYWVAGVKKNEEGEEKLELWSVPTNWVVPNHDRGLFSSFDIVINGKTVAKGLGPEAVARTYYPHPTNMQQAWSPLLACMNAAQIDNHILGSQKQMFKKGIFPNMVVTIGKQRGPDGKATDMRPVLKGHQRRQIVSAVREIWNQTANAGEPAIIDGLIDSIHKLQSTPAEMDWTRSGDSIKERVMQCFQVNPIFVGQVIGANRAQAAEAKQSVLENAVNPMIDAFSETATSFVGPMFETPERLVVWLEKAFAVDQEIQLKKWDTARKNHDVTTNEFRTNILNLPPLEDEEPEKRFAEHAYGHGHRDADDGLCVRWCIAS